MEHTSEDAQALIGAAQQIHAERHGAQTFLPGTRLSFPEAAKRTGIRVDRQRYHDAIEELEYEGAIEWDESARYARGDKHYLITQRGLHGRTLEQDEGSGERSGQAAKVVTQRKARGGTGPGMIRRCRAASTALVPYSGFQCA
jgi:hypothetical protein